MIYGAALLVILAKSGALERLARQILLELLEIYPFLAQVLTIGLIFILNFLGSSLWVFKDTRSALKS